MRWLYPKAGKLGCQDSCPGSATDSLWPLPDCSSSLGLSFPSCKTRGWDWMDVSGPHSAGADFFVSISKLLTHSELYSGEGVWVPDHHFPDEGTNFPSSRWKFLRKDTRKRMCTVWHSLRDTGTGYITGTTASHPHNHPQHRCYC